MQKWEFCSISIIGGSVTISFYLTTGISQQIKNTDQKNLGEVLAKNIAELGASGWEAYAVTDLHTWHFKRRLTG